MNTNSTLSRAQLRSAIEDQTAPARARLDAAQQLLDRFGLTARNTRILKRVVREFANYVGDPRMQAMVRERAARLKALIKAAEANGPIQDESDADADAPIADQPTPARQLIGHTELLPPDEPDDDFWDREIFGRTRRALLYGSWGLPATATREELLTSCRAHPKLVEARTLKLQPWACSRERLDEKFATDVELVRNALAARGLPDSDDGGVELVRQIHESGQPLFDFEPREIESPYETCPILVRSPAGLLLDAIDFVRSWPGQRATHQPL